MAEATMESEAVSQGPVYLEDIFRAAWAASFRIFVHKRRASQYTPLNQFLTSLGLEYRLFKHFGVGGAVNGLDVDVESPVGKSATFTVDNSWNTAFVYGSLYF